MFRKTKQNVYKICFFGPDGSGKTTLARKLSYKLYIEGTKSTISWLRGTHTLASIIARFFTYFSIFKGKDNPYYNIKIPRKLKSIWKLIELISILPVWLNQFIFPRILGYTIIAERSLIDFIVWIAITNNDIRFIKSLICKFLLSLAIKNCFNIYIRSDYEILIKRRPEDKKDFIYKQLLIYDLIANNYDFSIIDTSNKSINRTLYEVERIIDLE